MAGFWLTLSTKWKLEDVQAVLNIVISVFSTLGIFTFARFCWSRTTSQVAKDRNVPVLSLLTLATPGEALDELRLLRSQVFAIPNLRILAQCTVVFLLSVSATLSGPIARYSSRRGTVVSKINIEGLMATTEHNSIGFANVQWNQTQVSLDRAGFPRNQLLDYMPDPSVHWLYRSDEWNSTWTANCNFTPSTPIDLYATGNHTEGEEWPLFQEIPGIRNALSERFDNFTAYSHYYAIGGFYIHSGLWKDSFVFTVLRTDPSVVDNADRAMSISVALIHLRWAPQSEGSNGTFGKGVIPGASYRRFDCDLARSRITPDEEHLAYPWTGDPKSLPDALVANYQATMAQQSTSNSTIYIPSEEDLFRFYQVYMITKDTQYREPVTRVMTAQLPTVEISTIFLAVILCIALLVFVGLARYIVFVTRHRHAVKFTPDTKIDWLIQSLKESTSSATVYTGSPQSPAAPSTCEGHPLVDLTKRSLRQDLEDATYGAFNPVLATMGPGRVHRAFATTTYMPMPRLPPMQQSWDVKAGNALLGKTYGQVTV